MEITAEKQTLNNRMILQYRGSLETAQGLKFLSSEQHEERKDLVEVIIPKGATVEKETQGLLTIRNRGTVYYFGFETSPKISKLQKKKVRVSSRN